MPMFSFSFLFIARTLLSVLFLMASSTLSQAQSLVTRFEETSFEAKVSDFSLKSNERLFHTATLKVGNLKVTYFVKRTDSYLISYLQQAEKSNAAFVFETEKGERDLFFIKSMRTLNNSDRIQNDFTDIHTNYQRTVLTETQAAELFRSQRKDTRHNSQCFMRAEAWTYDQFAARGYQGEKIFVYYSRSLIEQKHGNWWFHVAPLYRVQDKNGYVSEIVFDPEFMDQPVNVTDWLKRFTDHADCPRVSRFFDFFNHQYSAACYYQVVPMYYFEPTELEALQKSGAVKNSFSYSQVKEAEEKAFKELKPTRHH